MESRPICLGKLSVGADWYLNGVRGNGNNDRDVVGGSCGLNTILKFFVCCPSYSVNFMDTLVSN